jgi:hypothetical protein
MPTAYGTTAELDVGCVVVCAHAHVRKLAGLCYHVYYLYVACSLSRCAQTIALCILITYLLVCCAGGLCSQSPI